MGLGMIGAAAVGAGKGFGEGVAKVSLLEMNRQIDAQRIEQIARLQSTLRRDDKRWELDEAERRQQSQTEKVNALAGETAQQERNSNLGQAEQTYHDGGYMEGNDAEAIRQTLSEARKQPATPTNRQRLDAQVALGYEKPIALEKLDAEVGATAESRAMRQVSQDETRRYHDALISQGNARIQQSGERGERVTPTQKARNFGIDASRKAISGLSPEEIKRKTQQYTNTGRENSDYDSQLAGHVRRAMQRKVGDDPWFDQNMLGEGGGDTGSGTEPIRDTSAVTADFTADPAMKGYRLGKRTDRGTEVFNQSGKLVGYYR